LVDTGPADAAEALVEEIQQAGFHLDDLERIVITHAHADHAGGADAILKRKRVKVYAHPYDIAALEGKAPMSYGSGPVGWLRRRAARAEPLFSVVPASPREPIRGLPHWQVLHTPGHTPGSLSLFEPVHGLLLCGDAITARGGRLTLADRMVSDSAEAAKTLGLLASLNVEVLACGHGHVLRPRAWQKIEALAGKKRPT
jgi:glyoxylase-like metal-dependent hydrolase (beta-lactamase superfamily II)